MKRSLVVVTIFAVLSSGLAFATGTLPTEAVADQETQILTRAAPTSAADGLDLAKVRGYRVTICAASGQTLTGGALQAWYYEPIQQLWSRASSTLDETVPSGTRCKTFDDVETLVRFGRVLYATSAVTVSGGTTVTVRIDGWRAP